MNYKKGEQITVKRLKAYLECIPDEVKVRVGIGDTSEEAHYLLNEKGELTIYPDCYMQDFDKVNLHTILSFNKKNYETD